MNVGVFSKFVLVLGAFFLIVGLMMVKSGSDSYQLKKKENHELLIKLSPDGERSADNVKEYLAENSGYGAAMREALKMQENGKYIGVVGALILFLGIGLFVAAKSKENNRYAG